MDSQTPKGPERNQVVEGTKYVAMHDHNIIDIYLIFLIVFFTLVFV